MSAILPPKNPPKRGTPKLSLPAMDGGGTPTRQKPSLALPKMSCGPPPIVSTPPLMAGGEAPAPGPSSRSSTDSNRPSLSIGSVGTTGSSTSSGLSVAQSRYPTTITHYDQDEEGGGKIANPDQIVGDIQKAIGATTLEDDLGSNQELPERPDVGRGRSSSSVIRPMIVRRPNTGDSGKSHRGSLEQSRGDGAPARQATSPPPRLDPSAELDEEPEEEVEIDPADLQVLRSLGEGAGGEVMKVLHKPTGLVMAKKTIPTSPNPAVHRQILRELAFNRTIADGNCPYLVKYYGAWLEEEDTQIAILMEFADGGSLEAIDKRIRSRGGRTGEKVLGKIAHSVLEGLAYLHTHKIIHRDIKPSNVVVTKDGQFKLCDLGVSGELVGSMAGTFVGTSVYMAPERIRGEKYTIRSDVWSLGLMLLELTSPRFPLAAADGGALHPFELLQAIITFQVPSMTEEEDKGIKWSKGLRNFIQACLDKSATNRPTPEILLVHHPWIVKTKTWTTDLSKWVADVWAEA